MGQPEPVTIWKCELTGRQRNPAASKQPETDRQESMLRRTLWALATSAAFTIAGPFTMAAHAEDLTIFWAEWDPANYLQELANQYTAETGVTVTVETTPWPDFQTKAFAEFNAKGDAYDMVVGDSQWLGAGTMGGQYVDLTDFFAKN